MRRETAARELQERLEEAGIRSRGIDLPVIWPAVAAWWRTPLSDVAPEDDERAFYLSVAPAAADPMTTAVFAGSPPSAIAGIDLVCIDFERRFSGGAGVSLWYAAGPAWERLRDEPGWIGLGVCTPHFDSFADGRHVDRLVADLEPSAVFEIASRERALALALARDDSENLVVPALGTE